MKLLPLTHRVEGTVVDERGQADRRSRDPASEFSLSDRRHGPLRSGKPDQLLAPAVTDDTGRFVMILPEGVAAGLSASHPRYIGPGLGLQADSRCFSPWSSSRPADGRTATDSAGRPVAGAAVSAELIEHHLRSSAEGTRP